MTSKVFFYNVTHHHHVSPLNKLEELAAQLNLHSLFKSGDLCAIKLHFGEPGNTSFVRPVFLRKLVSILKSQGVNPFLTDTNTLYYGHRANAVDHLNAAIGNGFDYAVVGAPLIIGDGITGKDYVNVPVKGKHFSEVKIGSAIHHADSMVVVSHFKGHEMTGFGATIKNLSMGCASRSGKQMMHSTVKPKVNALQCISCGKCVAYCPVKAISIIHKGEKRYAQINPDICYGCGECVVTCPSKVIKPNWQTDIPSMQERMADFAAGAVANKAGRVVYFNFLLDMSPGCDCYGFNDAPMTSNLGILASTDPVAIDKAGLDLVGLDVIRRVYPQLDPTIQLSASEQLGLGTQAYELIEV